jgi:hypothetical protein
VFASHRFLVVGKHSNKGTEMKYYFHHHHHHYTGAIKTCNRWKQVVYFTIHLPGAWGKSTLYPFDRKLDGLQSLSGQSGVEQKHVHSGQH